MSLAESRWPNQVYVALWSVNEASGDGGYVLIQFILYMHVHVCVFARQLAFHLLLMLGGGGADTYKLLIVLLQGLIHGVVFF